MSKISLCTQGGSLLRSSFLVVRFWAGALRDENKNGCEGDYQRGQSLPFGMVRTCFKSQRADDTYPLL